MHLFYIEKVKHAPPPEDHLFRRLFPLSAIIDELKRLLGHRLARNASWLMVGQGVNFFLQAAYFLLLARLLGATSYGIFAGAYALVNTVTPYSALGSSMLFMRYVSMDRSTANAHWGNTLATILGVSLVVAASFLWIGPHLLGPARLGLILLLVIANCVMSQIVSCASTVFLTIHRVRSAAVNRLLANLTRTITVVIMLAVMHRATAFQWGVGIVISTSLAAGVALFWVRSAIGRMTFSVRHARSHFWEGVGFSVAGSTESFYNDFDKVMLSHYGLNRESGIYTMAYRVVDFATTPINALVSATMPRLFALSPEGFAAVSRRSVKIIRIGVAIGFAAALFTFLSSNWIPRLAGHGFAEAALAIRWLCWLPIFRAIHQLSGSALTATGFQNQRTLAQLAVSVFNVGINLWLIPRNGWQGAAWASLASDGLLGVINVSLMMIHKRGGRINNPTVFKGEAAI